MKGFNFRQEMAIKEELERFLKNVVNSMAKLDLVIFFYNNPHTIDTVDGLAARIGRRVERIGKDIEELSEAEVVEKRIQGDLVLYSFSSNPESYALVGKFLKDLDDREIRLKVITYIIKLEGLT
ncbi:MAG: hypothetical protein Q8M92_10330 [Candidatus Subteraquimicrobiales bacterium]|nr:hypothetical protein [Candidatus Subteraquimicrobiales bacterium]